MKWTRALEFNSSPQAYSNQLRVTTLNFRLVVHAIKVSIPIKAWPSANLGWVKINNVFDT